MPVATHPTPTSLAAFARGELPPQELAAVAQHVAACAECCAALAVVPDDSLAGLARSAARNPAVGYPTIPSEGAHLRFAGQKAGGKDGLPAAFADHARYRLLKELGAGGMGVVYKAEDLMMGRVVAVKVMAPHLTARQSAVERFRKEVRAAAQLSHANIVMAHDVGEVGGLHFMVMEYVEGVSLDRHVAKKGPLPAPLAAQIARQAALGLQHAHEKGLVHRDIKPHNLMVNRKGHVKVMDFGLARFAHADDGGVAPGNRVPFGAGRPVADAVTNPNLLMGTPDYLSPEQAKNSHDVDTRSDVYSLGCTLFFLLTGGPPFAHASTLIDKLLAHTEEPPPTLRDLRPDVPEGLALVVGKMMAKHPDARYSQPAEAAAALLPFTRATDDVAAAIAGPASGPYAVVDAVVVTPPPAESPRGLVLDPVGGDTPAVVPDGPTVIEPADEKPRPARPKKSKRPKRVPWWQQKWAVAGAAGAVLAAVVIAAISRGKKTPDPAPGGPQVLAAVPQPKAGPKGTAAKPAPAPAKELKVLYVVPSDGIYLPDYHPVRNRLEAHGLKVEVASGQGGWSRPKLFDPAPGGPPGPPPPPKQPGKFPERVWADLRLSDADPANYAAVIFCGFQTDEYVSWGSDGWKTRDLLKAMLIQGKVVGAICVGQRVLMTHGILYNRRAAECPALAEQYPQQVRKANITWEAKPVVVDGSVVTASGPEAADEFADKIARAIRAE